MPTKAKQNTEVDSFLFEFVSPLHLIMSEKETLKCSFNVDAYDRSIEIC